MAFAWGIWCFAGEGSGFRREGWPSIYGEWVDEIRDKKQCGKA